MRPYEEELHCAILFFVVLKKLLDHNKQVLKCPHYLNNSNVGLLTLNPEQNKICKKYISNTARLHFHLSLGTCHIPDINILCSLERMTNTGISHSASAPSSADVICGFQPPLVERRGRLWFYTSFLLRKIISFIVAMVLLHLK